MELEFLSTFLSGPFSFEPGEWSKTDSLYWLIHRHSPEHVFPGSKCSVFSYADCAWIPSF